MFNEITIFLKSNWKWLETILNWSLIHSWQIIISYRIRTNKNWPFETNCCLNHFQLYCFRGVWILNFYIQGQLCIYFAKRIEATRIMWLDSISHYSIIYYCILVRGSHIYQWVKKGTLWHSVCCIFCQRHSRISQKSKRY